MLDRCVSRSTLLLTAAVLFLATTTNADEAPDDLIVNGGFERAADESPAAWAPHRWAATGPFQHVDEGRAIMCVKTSLDTLQPQATIQCDQQGEPISKYIYAQFIEHLGRCIYGGIWAEMLDDRKFYHDVGSDASPWHVIGRKKAISMVTDDSFVGEQTPLITADKDGSLRGLVQSGLGLRQGKGYTGYVWLKDADKEPSPVEINLVWDDEPTGGQAVRLTTEPGDYTRFPLKFTSGGDTDNGRLEIVVGGQGGCLVGTASLMPDDNVQGMRADTLVLLKQLNAPVYRWPGGNFVSGYDWRDGIGPRDRRPPRKNPAWRGAEHNDFGLDEFVAFCREVRAEPLIVVNTGFGDAYSAAQEVEYANGSAETLGGRWRIANGHPEPYNVRWWGIGNEMYGRWQLGHMQLGHYEIKHNEVVRKMREVDPALRLIAVGNVGEWSEGMLQQCGDAMDLISEHFYCHEVKDSVAAHVAQIPNRVRAKAEAHRRYRETIPGLADKDIRIAMDEWNYWYGEHVYGELGTRYFLKDGLGIAAGLHEFFRNTDIISMAQYAQTVNVIGCIKTNKTDAAFATTGLVLKLYRQRFGQTPLAVTGNTGLLDLDLAAALTKDGKTITIGVVNPHDRPFDIQIDLAGRTVAGRGQVWRIAGDDPMLFNEPGQPERVSIVEGTASFGGQLSVPPYSANLFAFPVAPATQ